MALFPNLPYLQQCCVTEAVITRKEWSGATACSRLLSSALWEEQEELTALPSNTHSEQNMRQTFEICS